MGERNEHSFKRRWRKVDTAIEHGVEKLPEPCPIAVASFIGVAHPVDAEKYGHH